MLDAHGHLHLLSKGIIILQISNITIESVHSGLLQTGIGAPIPTGLKRGYSMSLLALRNLGSKKGIFARRVIRRVYKIKKYH